MPWPGSGEGESAAAVAAVGVFFGHLGSFVRKKSSRFPPIVHLKTEYANSGLKTWGEITLCGKLLQLRSSDLFAGAGLLSNISTVIEAGSGMAGGIARNYRTNRCFINWHCGCKMDGNTRRIFTGAQTTEQKETKMETENKAVETCTEEPRILDEIHVEELAIDGICGVY
jgi:mycofactocin precursor